MSPNWHLKPGTVTFDLDACDGDDAPSSASPPSAHVNPPSPTSLRPRDPDFGLSEDPLLRPIEIQAYRLFQRQEDPTAQEILNLFLMMPRSYLRRQGDADSGCTLRYIVSGASPRSSGDVLSHCTENPYFTLVVNKFLQSIAPLHRFSTYVIRAGCVDRVHRDVCNGPYPAPRPVRDYLQAL